VVEIADRLGDRFVELTGCPPMVAHAAKIAWVAPVAYRGVPVVTKFVVPNAFVTGRLCDLDASEAYVDTTHLHFSGLAEAASANLVCRAHVRGSASSWQAARIVTPTERVGCLSVAAARDCGLLPGTPVAAGLATPRRGQLGAGMVEEGQLLDTAALPRCWQMSHQCVQARFSRTLVQMRARSPGSGSRSLTSPVATCSAGFPQVLATPRWSCSLKRRRVRGGTAAFCAAPGGRILPSAPQARGAWVGLDLSQTRGTSPAPC